MKTAIASRNAALDALTALANGGTVNLYTGAQPSTPETATAETLLASCTLADPAFGAAANGIATANTISDDAAADATGTAGWFRVLASDGTTALWDGTVGTSGADLNFSSVAFQTGDTISITGFTVTLPT